MLIVEKLMKKKRWTEVKLFKKVYVNQWEFHYYAYRLNLKMPEEIIDFCIRNMK